MKTRLFPTILVITSTIVGLQSTSLHAKQSHNWQKWGEHVGIALENGSNAGTLYQITKQGLKHISQKKIDKNLTMHGKIQLDKVNVAKNFTCYGHADLSKVSVGGVTTMYGPMNAYGCTFHDMDVRCSNDRYDAHGTVRLDNTTIKNMCINGKLEAASSHIKFLTTYYHQLSLKNSHVEHIKMMMVKSKAQISFIKFIDTLVERYITSSQKRGLVICRGCS